MTTTATAAGRAGATLRVRSSRGRVRAGRRTAGFTIVEIMIVIIIIVILAGLLLPAVLSALKRAKIAATRFEIQTTITLALGQYREDFGTYPPSCVWVSGIKNDDEYEWHTLYADDRDTMDGAECLVYFLRGRAARGLPVGTKTYGPYFEPKADALIPQTAGDVAGDKIDNDGLQAMQDAFRADCVYLYFKADRTRPHGSEYNTRHNEQMKDTGGVDPGGTRIDPKPGRPVRDASGRYYNPTTFQIISAGLDGEYNTKDDITNFQSQ